MLSSHAFVEQHPHKTTEINMRNKMQCTLDRQTDTFTASQSIEQTTATSRHYTQTKSSPNNYRLCGDECVICHHIGKNQRYAVIESFHAHALKQIGNDLFAVTFSHNFSKKHVVVVDVRTNKQVWLCSFAAALNYMRTKTDKKISANPLQKIRIPTLRHHRLKKMSIFVDTASPLCYTGFQTHTMSCVPLEKQTCNQWRMHHDNQQRNQNQSHR